jgi:hypothetical protein
MNHGCTGLRERVKDFNDKDSNLTHDGPLYHEVLQQSLAFFSRQLLSRSASYGFLKVTHLIESTTAAAARLAAPRVIQLDRGKAPLNLSAILVVAP